jgi:hypothetical protein
MHNTAQPVHHRGQQREEIIKRFWEEYALGNILWFWMNPENYLSIPVIDSTSDYEDFEEDENVEEDEDVEGDENVEEDEDVEGDENVEEDESVEGDENVKEDLVRLDDEEFLEMMKRRYFEWYGQEEVTETGLQASQEAPVKLGR